MKHGISIIGTAFVGGFDDLGFFFFFSSALVGGLIRLIGNTLSAGHILFLPHSSPYFSCGIPESETCDGLCYTRLTCCEFGNTSWFMTFLKLLICPDQCPARS